MSIWTITLVLAVGIVLLTRGSFAVLIRSSWRGTWLLVPAAALWVGLALVPFPEARIDDVGFALLMASQAMVLGFCCSNLRIRGMGVVLVGLLMNTLVIGLNQGMPVTDERWRDGAVVSVPAPERTVAHRPASEADSLGTLGARIVLPAPLDDPMSFGDLVAAVGILDVVFWASRRRRHPVAGRGRRPVEVVQDAASQPTPEPIMPEPIMPGATMPEPAMPEPIGSGSAMPGATMPVPAGPEPVTAGHAAPELGAGELTSVHWFAPAEPAVHTIDRTTSESALSMRRD